MRRSLVPVAVITALAAGVLSGLPAAAQDADLAPEAAAAADALAADPAAAPSGAEPGRYPTSSVQLTGHGYGHGRGMGQWGAYGYATDYGWSHEQILGHYYSNTDLGSQANSRITVRLLYQDGRDLLVTSGRDFTVADVLIAGGGAARIQLRSDGQFTITPMYSCSGSSATPRVRSSSTVTSTVASPGNDQSAFLAICSGGDTIQYRGTLSMAQFEGSPRTVNSVLMEDYLRSVVPKESPASWADSGGAAALRAQAVAARSYAYSENRYGYAKTCDTTSCQVYSGAGRNRVSQEDSRTDAATSATAGVVIRFGNGAIARAEFSSSTGGYTAGGDFPAVPDAGDQASPYHDWTDSIPVSSVESAYGVGTLNSVQVIARNGLGEDGGRARTVRVSGSARTVDLTGDEFRLDWGLLSDWYSVAGPPPAPKMYLRNATSSGPAEIGFPYGRAGDRPVLCDWNGDGTDTAGVYRDGKFLLRNSNSAGSASLVFPFGRDGDVPICGDWNADGIATVGVYRDGMLYLRNTNSSGPSEISTAYGQRGDRPVTGDWNGDGYDTIGVLRGNTWYLSDSNRTPVTSYRFSYGASGDQPLAGDWTGSGRDTVGIRRSNTFMLRNTLGGGRADTQFSFGVADDRGLAGNWDGRGADGIGVARDY